MGRKDNISEYSYPDNKKSESRRPSHTIVTVSVPILPIGRGRTVVVILSFCLRDWGMTLCTFGIRVGHGLLQNAIRLRSVT